MTGNLCESRFGALYATGVDRLGHPIGLMVGLQLLKHTCNVSDEEVVATWVENPYWQYFCGEQYFRHDLPIDPSLMTGFRKRIGQAGCEFILSLSLSAGLATKTVAKSSLAVVNVDTTVQDKAVTFPTDARCAAQGARCAANAKVSTCAKATSALARPHLCAASATRMPARSTAQMHKPGSCAPSWAGSFGTLSARDPAMSQRHRA